MSDLLYIFFCYSVRNCIWNNLHTQMNRLVLSRMKHYIKVSYYRFDILSMQIENISIWIYGPNTPWIFLAPNIGIHHIWKPQHEPYHYLMLLQNDVNVYVKILFLFSWIVKKFYEFVWVFCIAIQLRTFHSVINLFNSIVV